jgi:CRISPR-associated protein Cas2
MIKKKLGKGSAVMIYSADNEQGFKAQMLGNSSRSLVDMEGLLLVKT